MICDDACTFVQHSLHRYFHLQKYNLDKLKSPFFPFRYPSLAELAYGSTRKGCFEKPHATNQPSVDLDCPDIAPLGYEEGEVYHDPNAMKNPSQLVSTIFMHY